MINFFIGNRGRMTIAEIKEVLHYKDQLYIVTERLQTFFNPHPTTYQKIKDWIKALTQNDINDFDNINNLDLKVAILNIKAHIEDDEKWAELIFNNIIEDTA